MNQVLIEISRFFKSHEFKRALLMTTLMLSVGFALYFLNQQNLIIGVCIGILLTSFSDLQGSFRHRTLAMILSIATNAIILFIMNVSVVNVWLLLLFITILSFGLANLSVYGNRASSFTLSGLLAMVFSLIRTYELSDLLPYVFSFIMGGLLYIFVSSIYHWFTKKQQTIERLGELAGHTSDYLFARLKPAKEGREVTADQAILELQTTITEKQEEVRNLLLADRQFGGQSRSRNRNMLLLIDLIDMMELAVANPAKLNVVKEKLVQPEQYLPIFYNISEKIATTLQQYARCILDNESLPHHANFDKELIEAKQQIQDYVREIGLPKARAGAILLNNLHDYLEKQVKNLSSIERLLGNVERQRQIDFSSKKHGRFLTQEDYSIIILKENLTLKAPIFRHAIRLTLALVIGYSIGKLANVENAYWILLTIVVIMRPAYGLTKQRSNQRVVGTLFGVLLAIGLIQLSTNTYYFVTLAAFSMLFAFSLIQRNYLLAATAITLNVVFVFSLIDSNHWTVISYRLIDTLIGAGVSLAVSYLVFPNWEYVNINQSLREAIKSNREYLIGISKYYQNQIDEIEFRLLRKTAFLNTSEMNAAFQRFTKDPASKRKNYSAYYEIVTLNQSILSTLANLGSYIKNHRFAKIDDEIEVITTSIANQLEKLIQTKKQNDKRIHVTKNQLAAEIELENQWDQLEAMRETEIKLGKTKIDDGLRLKLQEIQLIKEELNWLQAATNNLQQAIKQI